MPNPPRIGGNKYSAYCDKRYRTKSGNLYTYSPTRNKRNVWTVSTKPYKLAHFATFPPDLIRPCILAASRPGDVVLDPFSGAGTAGVVATETDRRYVGIDINPDYCELARRRISDAAAQKGVA
jgi:site-specific DNA-methyltransferase (adenine-specific)